MLQSIIQSRQIQLAVLSKLEFFDTVRASEEIGNRVSLPDLPEFVLLKLHFWKYITRNQFAFRVIPGRFQLRTGRFCESPSSVEKGEDFNIFVEIETTTPSLCTKTVHGNQENYLLMSTRLVGNTRRVRTKSFCQQPACL